MGVGEQAKRTLLTIGRLDVIESEVVGRRCESGDDPADALDPEASVRNGSTTPIMSVRLSERFWATELGRYSRLRIASSTRSRVAAATLPRSLTTRETVAIPTPARAATSAIRAAGLGIASIRNNLLPAMAKKVKGVFLDFAEDQGVMSCLPRV